MKRRESGLVRSLFLLLLFPLELLYLSSEERHKNIKMEERGSCWTQGRRFGWQRHVPEAHCKVFVSIPHAFVFVRKKRGRNNF